MTLIDGSDDGMDVDRLSSNDAACNSWQLILPAVVEKKMKLKSISLCSCVY